MSRIWRWITPVAVAGGLVAGVPAIPAATASTAVTPIITISATSPHYPRLPKGADKVDGYAIVIYRGSKRSNTGVVSGTVTTAATNDTATLLAKPFGARTYSPVGHESLTPVSGTATYSFKVTPSLATQYEVQLSGTDTAIAGPVAVYVSAGGRSGPGHLTCSRTRCKFSFRVYTYVPTSKAYKTESRKHWYMYVAVGYPRLPKDYTLSKTSTASKAAKATGGYVQTFTFIWALRHGKANPMFQACTKDTESKDGLGLPGRHGCGNKHLPLTAIYAG